MKRTLALILAAVMLLSFTACGVQDIAQNIGEQKNKAVTRGTVNGNAFTSEYADITFTKPDSWKFATDAELAEAMNLGSETLDQSAFEKAAAAMTSVYDMMVSDDMTGNNLSMMYENLKMTNNTNITPDKYYDNFDKQYTEQTAIQVTVGTRQTVKLGKHDYYRADYTVEYNGITMTQYAYIRKVDNYMHTIIVTLVMDETIENIESMFS